MSYFTCEQCSTKHHTRFITLRDTMSGEYCPTCGAQEQCAACSELLPRTQLDFKDDVCNYICHECNTSYLEVRAHINRLAR